MIVILGLFVTKEFTTNIFSRIASHFGKFFYVLVLYFLLQFFLGRFQQCLHILKYYVGFILGTFGDSPHCK